MTYRFHKKIGKGRWSRYVERYLRPAGLEHNQRLVYNYKPFFTVKKRSHRWMWELPKRIARATNASEVLDAWVHFRHRRHKRPYHYFKALKRLVEVGGCDPTDWRFRLIATRIIRIRRRFLNLPRAAKYFGMLSAGHYVVQLSTILAARAHLFTTQQLVQIAVAFARVRVHDKYLFRKLGTHFTDDIESAPVAEVVQMVRAFAECHVHDYGFMAIAAQDIERRIGLATQAFEGSFDEDTRQGLVSPLMCPSIAQLAEVAGAFATAKYLDFGFFEMCAMQLTHILRNAGVRRQTDRQRGREGGRQGWGERGVWCIVCGVCVCVVPAGRVTPPIIAEMIEAFRKNKVNDIYLFEIVSDTHTTMTTHTQTIRVCVGVGVVQVLAHMTQHMYDYPPRWSAEKADKQPIHILSPCVRVGQCGRDRLGHCARPPAIPPTHTKGTHTQPSPQQTPHLSVTSPSLPPSLSLCASFRGSTRVWSSSSTTPT